MGSRLKGLRLAAAHSLRSHVCESKGVPHIRKPLVERNVNVLHTDLVQNIDRIFIQKTGLGIACHKIDLRRILDLVIHLDRDKVRQDKALLFSLTRLRELHLEAFVNKIARQIHVRDRQIRLPRGRLFKNPRLPVDRKISAMPLRRTEKHV